MFDKRLKSPRVRKAEFSFKADALQMNINHLFHLFNFFVIHKNQIIKKNRKRKETEYQLQPDLCKQTQDVNLWKKNKEMKHKEKENMQVSFWQTQIVIFKEKD